MIKIEGFNDLEKSGIGYGGHSGSKRGVLINNERWFLKYPKNTRSMENVNISYTTMPLSEELFNSIPEEYNGITVFSKITKEAYYKILEYRHSLFKKNYEELNSIRK